MIFSTDWHIDRDSIEKVKSQIVLQCELAKQKGYKNLVCLGDVFESRKAQPLDILHTLDEIIKIVNSYDLQLTLLPGNHDKVNYESENSYLDIYRFHPGVKVVREYEHIDWGGVRLHFIPYFLEQTKFLEQVSKVVIDSKKKNVLLTHIAVNGVRNNDGSLVENSLGESMFSMFDLVLVGHYHNRSKVKENIIYIGSLYPDNFGEDNEKGFVVLNKDLTLEYFEGDFPKYHKIVVDLNVVSVKQLDTLSKQYMDTKDNVRLELRGSNLTLKTIDTVKYQSLGIEVVCKQDDVVESITKVEQGEVVVFDRTTIVSEFKEYCKEKSVDNQALGLTYLEKQLKLQ